MTTADLPNIVVVLSDEHAAQVTGHAGHPQVHTPHLDRLSTESVTFQNAYCTSPMCVPSRLSLFSGRYVHQIGAWDNGVVPGPSYRSWAHHLAPAGYETVLIGRTHVNGPDRLLGFDRRLMDDLPHWIDDSGRPPNRSPEWRRGSNSHVTECGPGIDEHTRYDERVTELSVDFLRSRGRRQRPFLLYIGYMHPHFPLVAPPDLYSRYDLNRIELPPTWQEPPSDQHPVIARLRRAFRNDEPLAEDAARRATASYLALVSHVDRQVGAVLDAVDASGTAFLYTSDHGEMAGHHGIWQKQCFYDPAVKVPLLLRLPGEGDPARIANDVSLIDVLPTLRELAGLSPDPQLPGRSLLTANPARPVFAEYHAQGMATGGFMLKSGQYKYCAYAGETPQLFDLRADPLERHNLLDASAHRQTGEGLRAALNRILDPDAVDRLVRSRQAARARQDTRSGHERSRG